MFYKFVRFLARIIILPLYRVKVIGIENIPKNGNYIFCSNHSSMLDPFFLAGAVDNKIRFMGKRQLFENSFLKLICESLGAFPVDRDKRDLKAMRFAISIIDNGENIGIFPEGTRVKSQDRSNIKDGAGFIALKAKADIVPVEILSEYKIFKKSYIYFKPKLDIDNYLDMKNKDAMVKLMDDTFEKIYEEHNKLRRI